MGYTDLIFDLYGTLVDIHTEENDTVWEKTALYFGYYGAHYTASELKQAFCEAMAARQARAGQDYECFPDIPVEQVMSELAQRKGLADSARELGLAAAQVFRIASTEYIRLYPGVREALQQLQQTGCRLWLLSNAQWAFTAFELRHLGLGSEFDGIYISSEYGCRKPDKRFFRALLDREMLVPSQCLMIGNDRDTDIAGARAAGLDTLYMHTALTPAEQAPACPALAPGVAPAGTRSFEFEGDDWQQLCAVLLTLIRA